MVQAKSALDMILTEVDLVPGGGIHCRAGRHGEEGLSGGLASAGDGDGDIGADQDAAVVGAAAGVQDLDDDVAGHEVLDDNAVEIAAGFNCGVEAELGAMPSREDGTGGAAGPVYTNPDQAVAFCRETGIDALAPSFGTAHGIYKSKPVLDLDLVKTISEKTGLPLVMHGGSGVSPEDYRSGIRNGLRKINYYTYMSRAGVSAVKNLLQSEEVTFFHDLALAARKAMESDAEVAMKVFAGIV